MTEMFDEIVNRRGTDSQKWAVPQTELPMWMADMDFKTAPAIIEAVQERAAQGVYGYPIIPDEWYEAYGNWWRDRHGFYLEKDWLIFTIGVVAIISSAVRKLTTPNENVVVQTPVYNIFFNSIENNGRRILNSPLVYDGTSYHIDFEDLEQKLADPQTTMMLLSNPHNPIGCIWSREDLYHIGELCEKYHVVVIADEIHCDLTDPGTEYIPFASVSEACRNNSITCISPTKTFNIAGFKTAAAVVPNPFLRHKIWRGLNTDEVAEPSLFAIPSAIAAYTKGGQWLDELRAYIAENRRIFTEYLQKEIPNLRVVSKDATYLLWVDCHAVSDNSEELVAFLRKAAGLYVTPGAEYGLGGEGFVRINIACPKAYIIEGLKRLKEGIIKYQKQN
jgi:cystathionine beta-lyase